MEVLIVDDEQSITDALQIILSDSGHQVAVAGTAREGLDHISRKRFDVTITDLRLPDMSGLDLLTILRSRDPDSCVIVITAHGTPEVAAESARRGAFHFLCKPFLPSDILALVNKASTYGGRPFSDRHL